MKTIYKKLLLILLILPFNLIAQSVLDGTVLDSKTKQPIPGVNVVIQGSALGTSTDFDGKFKLNNLKSGSTIVFSFIGYQNQTITFSNQKNLTINLVEEANQLQEVVVQVGYGSVKKKDATGSVATLGEKEFNKGTVVTAENLLSGKIAGVSINTSGSPGSGSEIRIRGGSSLAASNDPLIVIDGLPISNGGVSGSTSILSSLSPSDIESFTILKDASATAIYGSRASNGVIIITTKRAGKKLTVDYNFQYGSGKYYNKIDVFSGEEYRNLITTTRPDLISQLGTSNTDWQDAIYRRTDFVENNVSIKGQLFNVIPTRFSFGNTYQEGLRLTNSFTRSTLSVNLSPSFFDNHLKLRLTANYAYQLNRFADGVEGSAIRFDPTQPIYDNSLPSGGFFEYFQNVATLQYATPAVGNPVAQLLQTSDNGQNNRGFGNFEVDYKFHFFPSLRAVINIGFDRNSGNRRIIRSKDARSGFQNNNKSLGTNNYDESTRLNKLLDTYLVYNKKFGKLDLEATAGYSYQKFENSGLVGTNFTDISAVQREFADDNIILIGFFGRANFNINDKYLVTLNYRRDGTSRFGADNRWGNFPAIAFAWKLKEDFFKKSTILSDLKLRLGYGITGQQDIPATLFYLPKYTSGNANSQYILGNDSYNVGLPQGYGPIKWEETKTYNAGIDFGIAQNRLKGTLDLFFKKSSDLFQTGPFADGSNFTNEGPQNIGDMSIKGFEFSLDYELFKSQKFNWNVNVNFTKYDRKIDKIAAGNPVYTGFTGAGTGGTSQILAEGYTPNSFFVYKQLYDLDGQPIEGGFQDLNEDGIINGDDRYIHYNPDPDFLIGFSSNISYSNFDLAFNLRASVGNRILNTIKSTGSYYSQIRNGVLQNLSTNVLETNFQNQNGENVLSDIFIENGSFLRMDYATLGYTFQKWLEGKASLRLFGGIQNPFIVTKYSGLDPELSGGIDSTIYPRQRQVLVGANVKF